MPAAPTYKKKAPGPPTCVPSSAAAATAKSQTGAAAGARAAASAAAKPAAVGAELPRSRIYFDTASEVAELAARVLKKHNAAKDSSAA